MRSSIPLTPFGMTLKSWMPILFCVELNGQWSVAMMSRTPPATAAFSPSWCSLFLMGGLITKAAATCDSSSHPVRWQALSAWRPPHTISLHNITGR